MGVCVIADELLQEKINAIAKNEIFCIGLIIGQHGKEKDFIIHLASTPLADTTTNGETETLLIDSILKVHAGDIYHHARQLCRMLPGGIEIIGLFVATPYTDFNLSESQAKLQTLLTGVCKATNKYLLNVLEGSYEKHVLHICTETFKVSCKTVNFLLPCSLLTHTELKFQRGSISWLQFNYSYEVDLAFWILKEDSGQSLYKSIVDLLMPWAKKVSENILLFDGMLIDAEDFVNPQSSTEKHLKKKHGKGIMEFLPPKIYHVEFLDACKNDKSNFEKAEKSCLIKFSGTVAGRAFAHSKVTAGEVTDFIYSDLIKSVISRWEMHCDSLVEEPPTGTGSVIHEPPRRVFFEGGGLPISLCDYLFPGDSKADACQSAQEILNIIVHEENVDDSIESFVDPTFVAEQSNQLEVGISSFPADATLSHIFQSNFIMIALSVLIVIVGIVCAFYLTRNKDI